MKLVVFALAFFFAAAVPAAGAADSADAVKKAIENFDYQTVTTKEGLTFRVPEDMPIETRNGITAPIGFDEYIYGKFKLMDSRLQSIESKLERVEAMLVKIAGQKDAAPGAPPKDSLLRSKPNSKNGEAKK